jgi:hypothetical protein
MAVGVGGLLLPGAAHQAFADNNTNKLPDLVAIKNGEPDIMFNKGCTYGRHEKICQKGSDSSGKAKYRVFYDHVCPYIARIFRAN